jgi:hypothetical protein
LREPLDPLVEVGVLLGTDDVGIDFGHRLCARVPELCPDERHESRDENSHPPGDPRRRTAEREAGRDSVSHRGEPGRQERRRGSDHGDVDGEEEQKGPQHTAGQCPHGVSSAIPTSNQRFSGQTYPRREKIFTLPLETVP